MSLIDFGYTIFELRKEANLTQLELANKIGSSYSYISRLECGKVDPRWSTVVKIFKAVGKDLRVDGHLFNLIDN